MSEQSVTLVAMSRAEFSAWARVFEDAYAEELVERLRVERSRAGEMARAELAGVLPEGVDTPSARLRKVVADDGTEVGVVWWGAHPRRTDAAYVFDVVIHEASRGRGYGRSAMLAAEAEARAAGYVAIGLSVTGSNTTARRLYDRLGYQTQSVTMLKDLHDDH